MRRLRRRIGRLLGPFGLRATDRRLTASRRGGDTRVLVAPRLIFFLTRRRMAFFKDVAQQRLLEAPRKSFAHLRSFLTEEEVTLPELAYAVGYLLRSTFYPAAAFLTAVTTLIATVYGIGHL